MLTSPERILETVTDIHEDKRITKERIESLLEDLGYDPESADYNVVMEDMVPPTTGEAMMSKRAQAHEERLVIDAIIRETLSHPPLAIYSPKEEDIEQIAIIPQNEEDEIGSESIAGLWLHMASEVSKANSVLLISPVIISIKTTNDTDQHFHFTDFDLDDARKIVELISPD